MAADYQAILPVVIGTLAVLAGWPIVHKLNLRREIAAEKRRLQLSYLLEAYRKLEGAANRPLEADEPHTRDIESAIADIQLLGTPEQVKLAQDFSVAFVSSGTATLDPILLSLRRSLRRQLELDPVDDTMKFMRIVGSDHSRA